MAELFVASSEDLPGRSFVLKRVRPDFAGRGDFVRMFRREAALMVKLDHPNIVRVFEVGEHETDAFIAMEHLRGRDVRRVIRTAQRAGVRLPLGFGVELCLRLLDGLSYAHAAADSDGRALGLVHRDVSPSNLFVTEDGTVKLLDFGIAKARTGTPTTSGDGPKGKGCYMAPEQCRASTTDHRADIFAVGAVLYELTTMLRAFGGPNDMAILLSILDGDVQAPSEVDRDYPKVLEEVVLRALSAKPEARFESAATMGHALEQAAERAGIRPSSDTVVETLRKLDEFEANESPEPSFRASSLEVRDGQRWMPREIVTRTDNGIAPVQAPPPTEHRVVPPPQRSSRWSAGWLLGLSVVGGVLVAWNPGAPSEPDVEVRTRNVDRPRQLDAAPRVREATVAPREVTAVDEFEELIPPLPSPSVEAPPPTRAATHRRPRAHAAAKSQRRSDPPKAAVADPVATPAPVSGKIDDALRPPNL